MNRGLAMTALTTRMFRNGLLLAISIMGANAHGATTELATEPFALATKINALPNVMFILDDSGSMNRDYSPDWAGPYQQLVSSVLTTITPPHRFFNSSYNGVAYNPATRYRPPTMFDSGGALDTTTYPSMDGSGTTAGGDATATSGSRNWRAVKVDSYGVQSALAANLEGAAYSYTTVAGEYCTAANLRTCTAASAPSGSYTFPAPLRWCTTSALALDTTANAGTSCIASNIEPASGITDYTYPRIARQRTATISVGAAGTVTSITVDGVQILSASATGGTSSDVATDIAAKINACTLGTTGACAAVGFSATSASNIVTVTAPTATTSTPVVTGGTTTPAAFSGGNVPGATLFTVITPTINSYAYPGTATKASSRTDCAGTTCTYIEEMTNYANWYTYYRTRMQMMKTSAGIAFSNVDDKYRVGYYSINNATGSDFLNLDAFTGAQKHAWYTKFFAATPFGATPLRSGLANIGRMYAGKLSTLNAVSVTDPVQYSCQQNFSILSTDGYWNDVSNPVQVDGSAPIGNQDGNDPRPYYDGTTQARTATQTIQSDYQVGYNSFRVDQRTQQQTTSTSRLDQGVTTTKIYPYSEELTELRMQETPLIKSEYRLERREYQLRAETRQLEERTFQIQQTTRPLERYTYNLAETTYPLQSVVTNIRKRIYPLQQKEDFITRTTYPLQKKEQFIRSRTTTVQGKEDFITRTISPLQRTTTNITVSTYPLESSTYRLQSSTRQLQKRQLESSDGGDSWVDSNWVNATSCTVTTTGAVTVVSASLWTKNTTCQYAAAVVNGGLNSCTIVAASPGPTNYTVAQSVGCTYETTPTVTAVASCTPDAPEASSPFAPEVRCGYKATTSSVVGNQASCTARNQPTNAPMTGDKVVCAYDASGTTTAVASCTRTTTNTGALPKVECGYGAAGTPTTGLSSCTARDESGTNPVTWNNDKVVCAYENTSSFANQASCTVRNLANFSNTRIQCQWNPTAGSWTGYTLSSCSANSNMAVGSRVECELQSSGAASWVNAASCTPQSPANYSGTTITCQYGGTSNGTTPNLTSCTVVDQPTSAAMTGDRALCAYTGGSWANAASCTPRDPGTAYNNSRISCQYGGTTSSDTSNNTTCTVNNQPTNAPMTGDRVRCDWAGTSTTTTVTSCQWSVPASPSATRTQCQYAAGTVTGTNLATCTPVPQGTNTANGQTWTGPAKTCAYEAAVVSTNLTTCSPTGTNNGTNSYTTCGYGTAVVTNNLNSCVVDPAEAGPSYTGGATTACAYQGTSTTANVASCTPVAQSGTFSAPEKQCVYAAAVTTNVASCTRQAVSGSAPFAGPAVNCLYSGTASSTNTNLIGTCTANDESGANPATWTGNRVTCAYNGTPVVTEGVATCNVVAQSPGPTTYVGPAVACAYDATPDPWTHVASSCTEVLPSAGPTNYVGPARACAYNGTQVTNLVGAPCNNVGSTGSPYNILTRRVCTPGSFPEVTGPVVTVVDSCSTDPTSVTDPVAQIQTNTATTCAYRAPDVANTPTCAPVATSGASPFVTAVTCPITDTGWVAVAPTCTPIGILGSLPATPPTLDGTGKAVGCQSTDTTTYTADYPSGPVPVASCTAGTDAGTKVQTTCTNMTNTSAPVASCTPISPATAPSYLLTTCSTTTTSSNVMGCSPSAPTSPLFQTITCVDNGDGTSNTLADVAAYYYKTDLRTPALNNCIGAIVAPATSGSVLCTAADPMNNVPTTATDTNAAQHMTTFTLGLGVSGYMKYSSTYNSDATGDFPTVKGVAPYAPANGISADPSNGVCPWQSTGLCNWPAPAADEQTAVDDLWHAGVNGRGAYFSATDPVSLGNSISSTLAQVAAAGGVAAAGTVSSPVLTPADSYVFMGSYKSVDWTGELIRVTLDPFSGLPSTTIDWSAQAKLDAKAYSARNIWTFDSSIAVTKLKAFTSANFATNSYFLAPHISGASTGLTQFVCSAADICLSAVNQDSSHASGANLVNYLRGERTNEGAETDNTKYYRQRANVLGDIVNAQVAYVPPPFYEYVDPGYDAFKTAQASRLAMVYVGANDGMLHAFAAKGSAATETAVTAAANAQAAATLNPTDAAAATAAATASAAATAALSSDTQIGQEQWAYIPSKMLPNLYRLADKKYRDKHRYFVDSTPVIGDVCTANCANAASAEWKTILVGGLGRGGRGYYALDITDPANPKALWEFSDTNMGYTYGPAQIAKMANGTWVVLLSSGYNNIANDDGAGGDGVGRMYIVNAGTGVEIPSLSPMTTGVGSTTTPSGLGKLSAQVVNPATDATIGAVYAGDLLGNLWRFDINDTVGVAGTEAFKLAWLKDVSGVGQPITTLPIVSKARGKYIVLVGTGQLLAASDSATTAQQTLYGIIDDRVASQTTYDNPGGATTRGSNLDFVQQTLTEVDCPTDAITEGLCVLGERVFLNSSNAVDYAAKKGWFMDFIVTGERVNTDPVLALGLFAMNTAVPSLAACDVGGKTYQHWIDYQTGGALSTTNVSGIKAYDLLTAGLTAFVVPDGVKLGTPIGVRTFDVNVPPGSAAGKPTRRNSWRELIRE